MSLSADQGKLEVATDGITTTQIAGISGVAVSLHPDSYCHLELTARASHIESAEPAPLASEFVVSGGVKRKRLSFNDLPNGVADR